MSAVQLSQGRAPTVGAAQPQNGVAAAPAGELVDKNLTNAMSMSKAVCVYVYTSATY